MSWSAWVSPVLVKSFDAIEPTGLAIGSVGGKIVRHAFAPARANEAKRAPPRVVGKVFEVVARFELLELLRALAVVVGAVSVERLPDDEKCGAGRTFARALPLAQPEEHHGRQHDDAQKERPDPREAEPPRDPASPLPRQVDALCAGFTRGHGASLHELVHLDERHHDGERD